MNNNLQENLLTFRTAYLKAIAKSWADEKYKAKIISSKGTCKNVLSNPEFTKLLPEGTSFDWRVDISIVESGHYDGYSPYDYTTDRGWPWSSDVMIIKIPQVPKGYENDQDVLSKAIADYYSINTTMFGSKSSIKSGNNKLKKVSVIKELFATSDYNTKNYILAALKDMDNNLGADGTGLFFSFGASLTNLITYGWDNPMFFKYLTDDETIIEPVGKPGSTIQIAWMEFKNPWGFRICFELDENAIWDNKKSKWVSLSKNEIYLGYPIKPKKGFSNAEALMRYNNTTPAYPLTCAF